MATKSRERFLYFTRYKREAQALGLKGAAMVAEARRRVKSHIAKEYKRGWSPSLMPIASGENKQLLFISTAPDTKRKPPKPSTLLKEHNLTLADLPK